LKRRAFLGLIGLIGCKDELEDMEIGEKLWWLCGASGSSPSEEDEADWVETYLTHTPTYTGFSVDPVGTMYYKNYSGMVHAVITVVTHGTSNATSFTFTLPQTSANNGITQYIHSVSTRNNGTNGTAPGLIVIPPNSTTATLYRDGTLATWTAASTKSFTCSFQYEIN